MAKPARKTASCLVRDRDGIFYEIPQSLLKKYAVKGGEGLKAAVKFYRVTKQDVQGMANWSKMTGWGSPIQY